MADAAEQPFHSIESAHEFMVVLENVIVQTQAELQALLDNANSASDDRRTKHCAWRYLKSLNSRPTPAKAGEF